MAMNSSLTHSRLLSLNFETQNPIITIDGPAGTGKSTIAYLIAEKLGWQYYNTGALYRMLVGWMLEQKWIDGLHDHPDLMLKDRLEKLVFEVKRHTELEYFINHQNVTHYTTNSALSLLVSKIASWEIVRGYLLKVQRDLGLKGYCIFEGRDMGSVVFPDAWLKFYLSADPAVRAKRRFDQLNEDLSKKSSYEEILEQIKLRDYQDENRKIAPLCIPKGAIIIDTTFLSIEDVVSQMELRTMH
jgi:cytidylate kinase